jgi:Protein of unknown function (DUF1232)
MIAGWLFCWWRLARLAVDRCLLEATIFGRVVLLSFSCAGSKLALALGIAYSFGPIDLIPNSIPYYGHLDEIGFVIAGLMVARLLVPRRKAAVMRARRPQPDLLPPMTVVFCHCPKTAGTSLFRALSDRLGYRASYLMRRQRPDLALLQQRGFALVSGHAPYGHYLEAGAAGPSTRFITFYREPRAVILSHFAHVVRHRREMCAARTLFEVDLPRMGHAMTSPAAVRLFMERIRQFDNRDADNPQTRFAANQPYGPLDASHLAQAKATFAAMALTGCAERFEESLQLMAFRFGWPGLEYHRLNVSSSRQKPAEDPELLVELDRHLAFDRELITWANARFQEEIAAMHALSAATGRPLPTILRLEATPPYQAWRHRIAAASTLLMDDWIWWLGAKREAARRAMEASRLAQAISRSRRGGRAA